MPVDKERGVQMQIFVSTDSNIEGHERFALWVESEVARTLSQFESAISRVDAHLKDESANAKGGDHIMCSLEARAAGLQPVAVSHLAASANEAVTGAVGKLKRALDTALGRLREHKGAPSIRNDDPTKE
jgi:hypothetical protein